jgi:Tfp pilus assembly protein FimV
LLLARALVKLGRRDEAVPLLKAFLEHEPDNSSVPEAKELLKETQKQ